MGADQLVHAQGFLQELRVLGLAEAGGLDARRPAVDGVVVQRQPVDSIPICRCWNYG